MILHTVVDGPADAPVLVLGPSLGTDTACSTRRERLISLALMATAAQFPDPPSWQ